MILLKNGVRGCSFNVYPENFRINLKKIFFRIIKKECKNKDQKLLHKVIFIAFSNILISVSSAISALFY